jgi:uncharacterized protein (TIGR02466 family)
MSQSAEPPNPFDADGVAELWPTRLMKRTLPGAEAANKELLRLILEADKSHADMTADYLAGNFLTQRNPAVDWLRQCINKTVIDYLKAGGLSYQVDWTLQGWANVNRLGDYHDPHNHPHAYLSGTYYVQMPQRQERLKTRSDLRPGAISFYDPRGQANMTAIRNDPNIEAEFTLKPEAGTVLLWPAFLMHFVHPNLSQQPRVSISFNVVLKWRDDYLPRQEKQP